jgi:hypothetical protein
MADLVFPGLDPDATVLNSDAMPENVDMVIYKGDYVDVLVTVNVSVGVPMDLSGYTAAASLKIDYEDVAPVDFTCTIVGDGSAGQVRIYLPTTASSTLVAGDYIWDFELINGDGDARTYMTGDVTVHPEVTTAA